MAISVFDWLNGDRDYAAGVQILRDHEQSGFLVNMLADGPDAYNTPKLLSEIEKLLPAEIAAASHNIVVQQVVSTASHNEALAAVSDLEWQVDDLGDTLSDLISQVDAMQAAIPEPGSEPYSPNADLEKKMRIDAMIKSLWKEMCYLQAQLDLTPEGRKLYELAKELTTKKLKRQDLWDQLHYFNAHGVWFDDQPENQPKPENPEQEIKNLMANRSKVLAKLKKPLPVAKAQFYQDKIAALNVQIDNLKKLRDGR